MSVMIVQWERSLDCPASVVVLKFDLLGVTALASVLKEA